MALAALRSPVPAIQISLAPYEAPAEEPKSPFACFSPISPADDDGPRSALLTPPPVLSPARASPLSPLRPADSLVKGNGLERERFEAMLKASRERNGLISGGTRRTHDLRKEIALKAHKSKQCTCPPRCPSVYARLCRVIAERRALFLSKLQAPPSPTATMTAKTPPESPAILHYTLPSPGLASPLALYEAITEADQQAFKNHGWVEQVDFRLPEDGRVKPATKVVSGRGKPLPSLAQISARLSAQGNLPTFVHAAPAAAPEKTEAAPPKGRLPAFLQKKEVVQATEPVIVQPEEAPVVKVDAPARPRVLLTVGRLRAPAQAKPTAEEVVSPGAPPAPKLHVTTTVIPRVSHTSPVSRFSHLPTFTRLISQDPDGAHRVQAEGVQLPCPDGERHALYAPSSDVRGAGHGPSCFRRRARPPEAQHQRWR
jgi:hypothetical protein